MSVLPDKRIASALAAKSIVIEGMGDGAIQPASVDLYLDWPPQLLDLSGVGSLDATRPMPKDAWTTVGADGMYHIEPGDFLLAVTRERIMLGPKYAGFVSGLSSLGRMGLNVCAGCGWIDPGFTGNLVLEISNATGTSICIRNGMRIAQLIIYEMDDEAAWPYGHPERVSKYQGQAGVVPTLPDTDHSFITITEGDNGLPVFRLVQRGNTLGPVIRGDVKSAAIPMFSEPGHQPFGKFHVQLDETNRLYGWVDTLVYTHVLNNAYADVVDGKLEFPSQGQPRSTVAATDAQAVAEDLGTTEASSQLEETEGLPEAVLTEQPDGIEMPEVITAEPVEEE